LSFNRAGREAAARETLFSLQFPGGQAPKQNIHMAGEFQPCRLYCQSVSGRFSPANDQVSEK
jgi:hypothetical protein